MKYNVRVEADRITCTDSWRWQWCCSCSYPLTWPYYANFMNAVLEKIHAVGTYTWVNLTSLPQNVLQASHSLNWHRKDSHTILVSNQFVKTVFIVICLDSFGVSPLYIFNVFWLLVCVVFWGEELCLLWEDVGYMQIASGKFWTGNGTLRLVY